MTWNLETFNFYPYRGQFPTAALGIAMQTIPTGAILGAGVGAIIGFSILLARHRPRLAQWFVVGLLICCVVSSAYIVAFDRVVDFVVKTRLEGVDRLMVSWTIRLELASAIGTVAGALVGAVVAYGAVRLSDRGRASHRVV